MNIIQPTDKMLAAVGTALGAALLQVLRDKGLIDADDIERVIAAAAEMGQPIADQAVEMLRAAVK